MDLELGQHCRVQPEPGVQRPGHGHHPQQCKQQLLLPVVWDREVPAGMKTHFSVFYPLTLFILLDFNVWMHDSLLCKNPKLFDSLSAFVEPDHLVELELRAIKAGVPTILYERYTIHNLAFWGWEDRRNFATLSQSKVSQYSLLNCPDLYLCQIKVTKTI